MHSLILAWASWILALLLPAQTAEVSFYNEKVEVEYRPEIFANGPLKLDELGISYHYASVTEQDWMPLHDQLQNERVRLELNDWLYTKLVHETIEKIADFASENERRIMELHLLTLAGFDVRVCYDSQNLFVYGFTEDSLFEVPMITNEDRGYINLTSALSPNRSTARSLSLHPLRPLPTGKNLSFSLDKLPNLKPSIQERTFRFRFKGELLTIHGLSDRTIAAWMNDYPFFEEGKYMETPMSKQTGDRLLGELKPLLADRSELEKLELLVAFTRNSFVYKEDKKSFGFSKPMIADEVLFYPVSDCEDRSALFFTLVRELLDLPVIAIAYDDHLSVAVASKALRGKVIRHEGKQFYVCDPTGPKDSEAIGNPPYGYENRRFEVVAAYFPDNQLDVELE